MLTLCDGYKNPCITTSVEAYAAYTTREYMQQSKIGYTNMGLISLPSHRCMLTLYRSQDSLSMIGSK